jgi:uncharacterized protein YcfJ
MKNKIVVTLSLMTALSLTSAAAMAGGRHHHDRQDHARYEKARVIDVEPVYRHVRVTSPGRECWQEPRHERHFTSYTSTIAGGIVGGVVGNQFGGGNGKTAMTVAGTLLGGSIGRDLGHRDRYDEQCRVTDRHHHPRHIDGYHVTYRYHGQIYTTYMDRHPGKFIPVDVYVEPRHHRYY